MFFAGPILATSLSLWPLCTVIFLLLMEKTGIGVTLREGEMDKEGIVGTGSAFGSLIIEQFPDSVRTGCWLEVERSLGR